MIQALIFDFDGLITDTETPDYLAWVEVYAEFGVKLSIEQWAPNVGGRGRFNPYAYLEEQIGREIDRVMLRHMREKRFRELCNKKPILPGVKRMIQQAKQHNLKLAVASNSFGRWVNGHLRRLDLYDDFDVIISLDQITIGKPEPKMYQTTLKILDVKPEEAIAFEDSPTGAMGAKRAGIFTVAIPNDMTCKLDFSHCDRVVGSMGLLDLDELLQQAHPQTEGQD